MDMEPHKKYYLLSIALLASFGVLFTLIAMIVSPTYTAAATVGAPISQQSSSNSNSLGGLAGVAAQFGINVSQPSGGAFSTYTQLLTSNRLYAVLAQSPKFMQTIFYKRYDPKTKQWIPPGGLPSRMLNLVREAFHYNIHTAPNQDDLAQFLQKQLTVVTSATEPFVTVSLTFYDPHQAEMLLSTLLVTADNIVREDVRKDTAARLAYLERILPTVTQADQRASMISILSSQQQQMMMIASNKLFASYIVASPYANLKPTSPNITVYAYIVILLAIVSWFALCSSCRTTAACWRSSSG